MLSVHHLEENKKRQKHELLRCLLKLEVINHIWEGGPYSSPTSSNNSSCLTAENHSDANTFSFQIWMTDF